MAKRNIALFLSIASLLPGLFSCGGGGGLSSESLSSEPGEQTLTLSEFTTTFEDALSLGKEKTSSFSLTLGKDAYYKGKVTKREKALFEGTSYSNSVLSLSAKGEVYYANKDGGFDLEQGNQDFYHDYGYNHGLLIDAFYNVDGSEKSINSLRSKGSEMGEEEAKSLLNSGRLDFSGVDNQATILYRGNVYAGGGDFLYQTYFAEGGCFALEEAKNNVTIQKEGDKVTFSTYFDEADANSDIYRRAFLFEFSFADGLLSSAIGSEEDRLVSGESVSEVVSSASSFELSNSFEAKSESSADFNRFFYTDYIPFLGENPYSVTEVESVSVGNRYFVQIGEARPNTAIRNIDSISLESATRNGEAIKDGDLQYVEEDKAVTFLRGGDYELTFLSRAGIRRSLSASVPEEASL